MKKFMKGCAWTALILVIVGVIFLFVGKKFTTAQIISSVVDEVTNGNMRVNLDTLSDFGITFGDNFIENIGGIKINVDDKCEFNQKFDVYKGKVEKYCPGEGIEDLNIEVGGCTLVTKNSGDGKYYIEVEEAAKFQGFVEENTLYIKGVAEKGTITAQDIEDFVITLYVPENAIIRRADISVGAGNVELSKMNINTGSCMVGAGNLTMDSVNSEKLAFSIGAGKLNITDMVTGEFGVEMGMGDCTVSGIIMGDADVECAMGNVDLLLTGAKEDFNYELEGAMGNIDLDNENFIGLAKERNIDNKAERNMDVDCAMGNVTIKFTR